MAFGFTYTLPTIAGSHTGAPILLKTVDFPPSAIDGTANSLTNGGGSLIAYTDNTKTTRLSVDVVRLVSGGSPYARVWVKIPTAATSNTIFIENDDTQTNQPAFGAAFGRNSVWSDFELVIHGDNNTPVDSTGNHTVSTNGSPSITSTAIGDGISINSGNAGGTAAQWVRAVGTIATSTTDIYQAVNVDLRSAATGQKVIDLYNNSGGGSGSVDYVDTSGSNFRGVLNNSGSFIASSSSGTGIQRCTQFTDTNQRLLKDGSLVASSSKPGSFNTYDSLVIGKNGASNDQAADLIIVDYFYGEFTASVNLDLLFADNQLSTTAWGSVGSWVDPSGGGISLSVDSGSYSLTGTDVSITTQTNITANNGVYSLTGTNLSLLAQLNITTTSGSYSLTGSQVSLIAARELLIDSGSYNLTGTNVTLIYTPGGGGEILVIDSGVYSLVGDEVILRAELSIIASSGDYLLAGTNTNILFNGKVVADTNSYLLTGTNINVFANYGIIAQTTNYSLTGSTVTLRYSGDTSQTIGVVTAGFAIDKYSSNFKPSTITVTFKG